MGHRPPTAFTVGEIREGASGGAMESMVGSIGQVGCYIFFLLNELKRYFLYVKMNGCIPNPYPFRLLGHAY